MRKTFVFLIACFCLLFAASAEASKIKLPPAQSLSSVASPHGVYSINYFSNKQCSGGGINVIKTSVKSVKQTRLACVGRRDPSSMSRPVIVRDPSTNRVIVVWNQANPIARLGSKSRLIFAWTKGGKWHRRVATFTGSKTPGNISAAAAHGRLWIAYQLPRGMAQTRPVFAFAAFNEVNGRRLTANLTVRRRQIRKIYSSGLNNSQTMVVLPQGNRVHLLWRVGDASNQGFAFKAVTLANPKRAKLHYQGKAVFPNIGKRIVKGVVVDGKLFQGDNGRYYNLITRSTPMSKEANTSYSVRQFANGRFRQIVSYQNNTPNFLSNPIIAYGADRFNRVYLAVVDEEVIFKHINLPEDPEAREKEIEKIKSCQYVITSSSQWCYRQIAPENKPVYKILRFTKGKITASKEGEFIRSGSFPAGSSIVSWNNPYFTQLITLFGGGSIVTGFGQDGINTSGGITSRTENFLYHLRLGL